MARWRQRYPDLPLHVRYYDDDAAGFTAHLERIRSGTVDIGYIRVPEEAAEIDKTAYHRVFLYREDPVVCASADHWLAAAEVSVSAADIATERHVNMADMSPEGQPTLAPTAQRQHLALATVAAGAGVVILPASVARMLARTDVAIRTVEGLPGYQTGLAWLVERDSDAIQEFIGIARGRRAGSGRSSL